MLGPAMRRYTPIGAVAIALALAGCGGSSGTGSSSSSSGASAPTSTTTSTSSTSGSAATQTGTVTASNTVVTKASASSTTNAAPSLPANFVIEPGGRLNPSQVGAPAHTSIAFTVSSKGRHSHRVSLGTPQPHSFEVTKAHPGGLVLTGLHNGTYAVDIDGHPRGKLIVGVTPGP